MLLLSSISNKDILFIILVNKVAVEEVPLHGRRSRGRGEAVVPAAAMILWLNFANSAMVASTNVTNIFTGFDFVISLKTSSIFCLFLY